MTPTQYTSAPVTSSVLGPAILVGVGLNLISGTIFYQDTPRAPREVNLATTYTIHSAATSLGLWLSGFSSCTAMVAGAASYVSLGALIRVINRLDRKALAPTHPSAVATALDEAPTIKSLAYQPGVIQDSLRELYKQLMKENETLAFLRLNHSFSYDNLVALLADGRVYEGIPEGNLLSHRLKHGKEGEFTLSDKKIFMGTKKLSTVVHELMHFLHFRCLAAHMGYSEMARIVSLFPDNALEIGDDESWKADFRAVKTVVKTGDKGGTIDKSAKESAARILWNGSVNLKKGPAKLEAFASRFDTRVGGTTMWMGRAVHHLVGILIRPMAMIAGFHRENPEMRKYHGYSNPLLFREMLQEGLYGSLLPSPTTV